VNTGRSGWSVAPFAGVRSGGAPGDASKILIERSRLCVLVAEVPVSVNGYAPGTTPAVPTVKTLAPGGVTGLSVKLVVAPAGRPVVVSVAGSLKPRIEPIVTG